MSRWYGKVANAKDLYVALGEALDHFHSEYEKAREELTPSRGSLLWNTCINIPSVMEYRFGQLQEINAILNYLEIQYDKAKGEKKRMYYEHYNRQLTERLAEQYADIEPEVVVLREFIQQTALIRNLYTGITKGIDSMHYQIGHLVSLKKAGIEDATF